MTFQVAISTYLRLNISIKKFIIFSPQLSLHPDISLSVNSTTICLPSDSGLKPCVSILFTPGAIQLLCFASSSLSFRVIKSLGTIKPAAFVITILGSQYCQN